MNGRTDRTPLAVMLIVGSVFLLSAADAAVKALSTDYSLWQIYAARSAFSVPILLLLIAAAGGARPAAILKPWVLLRSVLMVAMWLAYYAALPAIDLSVAATGIYTAPVFIALFSSLLAGEPVGAHRWIGIVLGFAGVLVILRPGAEDFSLWALLPILAAVLYALSAIVTRARCSTEDALVLALGLHVGLLAVGIAGSLAIVVVEPASTDRFLLGGWSAMSGEDWLVMAGLGTVMVVIATGAARAYQIGAPAVVATFDYTYLVSAMLWGVLFFSETLDVIAVAGIAMIVIAGLLVLRQPRLRTGIAPTAAKE
jgi:drug/metabolite transporter (DMT)-like permease